MATDAEALDSLAKALNEEPVNEFLMGGMQWVREVVRSTGREVVASRPAPGDEGPTSGY